MHLLRNVVGNECLTGISNVGQFTTDGVELVLDVGSSRRHDGVVLKAAIISEMK
jgi:hypothetical protein